MRVAAGVKQADLAARLGQTQAGVSRIERGARRIDVIELREICAALDTNPAEFHGRLEMPLRAGRSVE